MSMSEDDYLLDEAMNEIKIFLGDDIPEKSLANLLQFTILSEEEAIKKVCNKYDIDEYMIDWDIVKKELS